MSTPKPAFGRGGEAAQEIADKATGGKFAKVRYFRLDDKQQGVYRFITDSQDWLFVKQHPSVPTKNKPADWPEKAKWPESMPGVCRHDDAFKGIYDDCYVCDAPVMNPRDPSKALKPALRVWALAVERTPVIGDGSEKLGGEANKGKLLGYKDATEDVEIRDDKGEPTGKTEKQKKIMVVNMGMKNFFGALQGIFGIYGTVCDRDYAIARKGEGLDTDYTIVPLDKVAGHEPGSESWQRLLDEVEKQNLDLGEIVAEKASDEYFGRFFDPSKTVPTKGGKNEGGEAGTPATPTQAPDGDSGGAVVDADRLAAMRERVRGGGGEATPTPAGGETSTAGEAAPESAPAAAAAPAAPVGAQNFE